MIECSKRLQSIIEWIDSDVIADVGCDHAYVAVEAVLENKAKKAYACDIASGPLEHAKKTIETYHVEQQVSCILMNGIENLPDDVRQIVIAGMGSSTIISILQEGIKEGVTLLLSPHKDAHLLREYLMNAGFTIVKEKIIQEDTHFYPVMKVCKGKQKISEADIYYGVNVEQSEAYDRFLSYEYSKWTSILKRIPTDKQSEIAKRIDLLKNRMSY